MSNNGFMAEIKYPRVMTSVTRHTKLAAEAKKRKMSIQDVTEEKFKLADKTAKRAPYEIIT